VLRAFLVVFITTTAIAVARGQTPSVVSGAVQSVSYFYVGGKTRRVTDQPAARGTEASGSFVVDQVGVLELIPASRNPDLLPVIMTPGFGLAGHVYLTTADGRPGWTSLFLDAGYPVYLIDRSHTTRTGFDVYAFNDVRRGAAEPDSQPRFVLWLDERIWARWGLGPAYGERFDDGQFPLDSIEQLMGAFAPVVSESMPLRDQARGNAEGIIALLEKIGPALLLTHSASGLDGFRVAAQRPDLVEAIVTVEPVGCDPGQAPDLQGIPVLGVFGDHLEVRPQMQPRLDACDELTRSLADSDDRSETLVLPELGIKGNSHIMMSDRNSDEIAGLILEWLENE
jgi:pimeloyl-ACP methyl ester carboxylesterase